jgi:murein DD-endopeptidase MepM/ murein hydrolase activator NlpD
MTRILVKYLVFALLAAGLLSWPLAQPVLCKGSLEKKIEQNRNKRDKLYEVIRDLAKDQRELSAKIAGIDERIDQKQAETDTIELQLSTAEKELASLRASQGQCTQQLSSSREKLRQRARAIYMEGELTYTDLLLQAGDINDLLDRLFFIQGVISHDRSIVQETQQRREELARQEQVVTERVEDIRKIREVLDSQKRELEEFKSEKQLSVEAINEDKDLYLKQIEELEAENNRIANEIREIANTSSGYKGKWTGSFARPVAGKITSTYGTRVHPIYKTKKMHTGVDISAAKGTSIYAAGEGKVIFTGTRNGYGKTVIIDHGGNRTTLYAHMSKITCDAGDLVSTKTKIGEVGSTGVSTGNHCHFEVRINGDTVDPLKELK